MTRPSTVPAIAFLLQTHDANPHLGRLCETLGRFEYARVFCHHDFSKSPAHQALTAVGTFCDPHRETAWGRVSQALATLDVLELAALQMPEAEWFILLSATCYPIKRPAEILELLSQTPRDGFLDTNEARPGEDLSGWWWKKVFTRPLFRIPFVSRRGRPYLREVRVRRSSSPFNSRLRLFFGANWFILRRSIVERLLLFEPKQHPAVAFFESIERVENKHMSFDECLIQTLLGQDTSLDLDPDPLRFIDWDGAKDWHPNILTMRHWDAIQRSNALFARKFDSVVSRELLDRIDAVIDVRH